ncbi:hypothetical protein ACFOOM_08675 [Streptomyces echinoruber]|uniref:CchlP n=1 Tax=Streptomyces echinoruber TaxID=68898 RepID=A0A918R8E4_9ACTN|nr:hypothetical protein [Streptomyces echinoruber]GGZ89907.1 hypothetical protein GCM10010389_30340 [Streptomyces echinoruber]
MEAELAALAASGASTMVTLMVSDAWEQVRARVVRLFARGGDEAAVEGELRGARSELLAAHDAGDVDAAGDVEEEWRLRLRRVLRADPMAARELRRLLDELDELGSQGADQPVVSVRNTITGATVNGPVFQGQQFSHLTFTSAPPRSSGAPPRSSDTPAAE